MTDDRVLSTEERLETCERCQMKLPEAWGTFDVGVRGGIAWRCCACRPVEGKEAERAKIVKMRKARFA
jgi:hypothetical protein